MESELKGKLSSGNLLALVSGKPMSSGSIFLSIRACAYCSENLTYSIGGSSREGFDLGGSFGRFLVARRFGRKLQTPFIGFGKGQGHESLGRSERPSDRGKPCMRNRPPSLAIQIFFGVHEGGRGRFFQTHGRVDSFFYIPTRACAYCSENLTFTCNPLCYLLPLWAILRRLAI